MLIKCCFVCLHTYDCAEDNNNPNQHKHTISEGGMFQRVTASVAGTRSHARCSLKSGNWGPSGVPRISLVCTPLAALSGRSASSLASFLPVALLPLDTIVTEACKLQGILAHLARRLQVTSHTPLHSKTERHTSTLGRAASPRHESAHGINFRTTCPGTSKPLAISHVNIPSCSL